MYETTFEFYDRHLLDDVRRGNLHVQEFFRLLALCHTVMPETKNGKNFNVVVVVFVNAVVVVGGGGVVVIAVGFNVATGFK